MKHSLLLFLTLTGLLPIFTACGPKQPVAIQVYSHRHYDTDQRLFELFQEQTGIQVEVVKAGSDELIERLSAEGKLSPADLLITADAGHLYKACAAGLLQPVESPVLNETVPAHLRDSAGHWYALTKRARVIVYNTARVQAPQLSTYEDLADPRWKGRVVTRTSGNIYNQSLLASMIAHHGEEKAEAWARGLVANFARPPQGNDRSQIKAVAAGEADLALVNTYYVALMLNGKEADEQEAARKVAVYFPNQSDRGTHINISGGGVVKHASHPREAQRLLEFLVSEEAQRLFAEANYEYPVRAGVGVAAVVAGWGQFKEDILSLEQLGARGMQAQQVADRAGWK